MVCLSHMQPTKIFFEAVTKRKPLSLQKKTEILKKTCVLLIKLLTLFNYWSNQMEKLIAVVKIFLLT